MDAANHSKPMSVVWIAGGKTIAHLATMLTPLATGLFDEDVNLTLLCPRNADVSDWAGPALTICQFSQRLLGGLPPIEDLLAEVNLPKPHLLHALNDTPRTMRVAAEIAAKKSRPWIVSHYALHGRLHANRGLPEPSHIITSSDAIQMDLQKHRHVSEKIELLHPALHAAASPKTLCNTERTIAVLLDACGGSRTDLDAALTGFAELKKQGYECVFLVCGAGRSERIMRKHAALLDLEHELTFVDSTAQSQHNEVIRAANLFISVHQGHSLNLHALEAMAAGVPVVAAECPVSDFLVDGQTARLYPAGDAAGLTNHLVDALADPSKTDGYAAAALQYVRQNHSPSRSAAKLASLYRRMIYPAKAPVEPVPTPIEGK